jgi:hypothetical protein
MKINAYIPSLMRTYSKFLSEVLNDNEGSYNILEKLIDVNNKN